MTSQAISEDLDHMPPDHTSCCVDSLLSPAQIEVSFSVADGAAKILLLVFQTLVVQMHSDSFSYSYLTEVRVAQFSNSTEFVSFMP